MDPAAEKRYQTLKRRLDALQYCQPLCKCKINRDLFVAIDSAALAEKLLNDLLKTTEGF